MLAYTHYIYSYNTKHARLLLPIRRKNMTILSFTEYNNNNSFMARNVIQLHNCSIQRQRFCGRRCDCVRIMNVACEMCKVRLDLDYSYSARQNEPRRKVFKQAKSQKYDDASSIRQFHIQRALQITIHLWTIYLRTMQLVIAQKMKINALRHIIMIIIYHHLEELTMTQICHYSSYISIKMR